MQQTWARELIARLHLRGDEHILDVGCGDGKVTAEIARAVPRGSVTGIDASAEMIAFAQKTFPPAQISKSEISDLRRAENQVSTGQVRPGFFQRRAALGGRSRGDSARRGGSLETRRTAGGFLRRQRQRARRFSRVAAGNAAETLARIFPQDAEAVFFLRARRLRKMAAEIRLSKSTRSSSRRRTRLTPARTVWRRGCARPGCLMSSACRKICAKNSSPPSRSVTLPNIRRTRRAKSMSAWCGWKLRR